MANTKHPIAMIMACDTMYDLKKLWEKKVNTWKKRTDIDNIIEANELRKEQLQWTIDAEQIIARYNKLIDKIDTTTKYLGAYGLGRAIMKTIKEVNRIICKAVDNNYPFDSQSLSIIRGYYEWRTDGCTGRINIHTQEDRS